LGAQIVRVANSTKERFMATRRVLSVGQCYADHCKIVQALQEFQFEIVSADTTEEALTQLRAGSFALVLVNRVYDGDGSLGLDLIRQVKQDAALQAVPVMLVSDYEDAQQEAVAAGAVLGFGKSALHGPVVAERVRGLLTEG
jgi:two-component system chemotaxis response regulator CheY